MRALSNLAITLTIVSSILFLALMVEIYYLLLWKKKRSNQHFGCCYFLFWNRTARLNGVSDQYALQTQMHLSSNHCQEPILKTVEGDETAEAELMRIHSLPGPPRFLFTITEETKEDLESDDGKSRGGKSRKNSRNKSLGELLQWPETPVLLSPLSSPPLPAQSFSPLDAYKHLGLNPLFEYSSPPPTLQFLRDAEEKHRRKQLRQEARNNGLVGEDGSFISIVIEKKKESEHCIHHQHLSCPAPTCSVAAAHQKPVSLQDCEQ